MVELVVISCLCQYANVQMALPVKTSSNFVLLVEEKLRKSFFHANVFFALNVSLSLDFNLVKIYDQVFRVKKRRRGENRCQFHQRFYVRIFCTSGISTAFSSYILALAKKFVQKMRAFNVDEIDHRNQE